MASSAFEKLMASRKIEAAAKNNPINPQQAPKKEVMELLNSYPEGTKFYKTFQPNLSFFTAPRLNLPRQRIVFKQQYFHTADINLQKLIEKEFINRQKIVIEVAQEDYLADVSHIKQKATKAVAVDASSSTIKSGMSSSTDTVAPVQSVAGQK